MIAVACRWCGTEYQTTTENDVYCSQVCMDAAEAALMEAARNMKNIVNLTPHALNIVTDAGTVTIPPSGTVARVTVTRGSVGTVTIDGVTVSLSRTTYGTVTDLPDPAPDTLYVVSAVVAAAARNRNDLVVPDDLIRDDQGRVVGARGLAFPA